MLKKFFSVLFLILFFCLIHKQPVSAASFYAGDLIKASGPAVYYYASDGNRYVFPNQTTYMSWYEDFSSVKTITDSELAAISIGGNVTIRPGTYLVKITTDPKVYAVEPGGVLRWVPTEAIAVDLYGSGWADMVVDVPDAFFTNYSGGDSLTGEKHPAGSLIKYEGEPDIYYINSSYKKRKISAMEENRFRDEFVIKASSEFSYPDNGEISEFAPSLALPIETQVPTEESAGEEASLSLSLDREEQDSRNVVRNTRDIPIAAFKFKAGEADEITVSTVDLSFYVDQSGGDSVFEKGGDNDDTIEVYASEIISNVSIYEKGNDQNLFSGNLGEKGEFKEISLDLNIPAGEEKILFIKADISLTGDYNAGDRFFVDITSVNTRALSGNLVEILGINPNPREKPRVIMTVADQGKLKISTADSVPDSSITAPGQNIKVNALRFESQNEPFVIERITLFNNNYETNQGIVSAAYLEYPDRENKKVRKTAVINDHNFKFSNLDLFVPEDGVVLVNVFIDIRDFRNSFDDGREIKISFIKTAQFSAMAEYTREEYDQSDFFDGNLIYSVGNAPVFVLRNSYPKFSINAGSPAGNILRSENGEVLKFNISNPSGNSLKIKRLTFKIVPSDVGHERRDLLEYLATVNGDAYEDDDICNLYFSDSPTYYLGENDRGKISFSIYDYSEDYNDATPEGLITDNEDYGIIEYQFYGDNFLLEGGESKVLVWELDTSEVASGSRILDIEILGDLDKSTGSSQSNFLWNDGYRDIGGYLVEGLPLEGKRLNFK